MPSVEKRLNDIIKNLSPEDQARLAINDVLSPTSVLTPVEWGKVHEAMTPEEGHRYNAFLDRFDTLRSNVATLWGMAESVHRKLLERDRILWYVRGVIDVEEAIVFNSRHSDPLLVNNPNLKPGKSIRIKTPFVELELGVWSKKRIPLGRTDGVQMNETVIEILGISAGRIRHLASEVKAVFENLTHEAESLGLRKMGALIQSAVEGIAEYDIPVAVEVSENAQTRGGRGRPPGAFFPVENRWALIWDEVEPDKETKRRMLDNLGHWWPPSSDRGIAELGDTGLGN